MATAYKPYQEVARRKIGYNEQKSVEIDNKKQKDWDNSTVGKIGNALEKVTRVDKNMVAAGKFIKNNTPRLGKVTIGPADRALTRLFNPEKAKAEAAYEKKNKENKEWNKRELERMRSMRGQGRATQAK